VSECRFGGRETMRAFAIAIFAATAVAASVPEVTSAAEIMGGPRVAADRAPEARLVGCPRGTELIRGRCVLTAPQARRSRKVYVTRTYQRRPVYVAQVYRPRTVYVAPTYYAPPVYVAPIYRRPVVRIYAGPRYVWGHRHLHHRHFHHRHYAWRR
jgi:hypothetical protein